MVLPSRRRITPPRPALALLGLVNAALLLARRRCDYSCSLLRRQLLPGAAVTTLSPKVAEASVSSKSRSWSALRVDRTGLATELVDLGESFPGSVLGPMDVAICGEHHNWKADHDMEVAFIKAFASEGDGACGTALGLEMIEQDFQPVLDKFNRGDISARELYDATQWKTHWGWRVEPYVPIFEAARELAIPLVALEAPDEIKRRVQLEGLKALTQFEKSVYIPDPDGFAATWTLPGFPEYARRLLLQRYEDLLHGGMLASKTVTRENYLEYQLLRDEAMASAAWRWISGNVGTAAYSRPIRRMVFLVGYYHVRYEYGVASRLRRFCSKPGGQPLRVNTILLNPTPEDSLADEDQEALQLTLPLGGVPKARWPQLADFIWTYAGSDGLTI